MPKTSDVGAKILRSSDHRTSVVYGYFNGLPNEGYKWYFANGLSAGVNPTNDGQSCVFASCRPRDFRATFGNRPLVGLLTSLANFDGDVSEGMRSEERIAKLRRFAGASGHIKTCAGPGWALVGDAGYFKDPATAHGITDALLDANRLTATLTAGKNPRAYQRQRDAHAIPLFETTQRIASFNWTYPQLKKLHETLSKCMKNELEWVKLNTKSHDSEVFERA